MLIAGLSTVALGFGLLPLAELSPVGATAWLTNHVILSDSSGDLASSTDEAWYSNPVNTTSGPTAPMMVRGWPARNA